MCYNDIKTIEEQDEILRNLWSDFGDVPMNPDTECLEEDFLGFPTGTHREDIWRWFDARYSKGVASLLLQDGIDRTDVIAKMTWLYGQSFECTSEQCVYNKSGECRYMLVHEKMPVITEEEGCVSGVINA